MKSYRKIYEMIVFSMLGSLMFASKIAMESLPNIHPIAMFIMVFTVVYRAKALIPIYVFIFITGFYYGFALWWIPYLYIWAVLWGVTMLLPLNMPDRVSAFVYPIVCSLFGLAYGVLYAPAQAAIFSLSFNATLKWIVAGLPFDAVHAFGNLCIGLLILPLSKILKKLDKKSA